MFEYTYTCRLNTDLVIIGRDQLHSLLSKILRLLTLGLSEYAENHVFGSFNFNNSEKHRISFEDIFLGNTKHLYKKNEPTLGSSGGCTVRSAGS